MGHRRDIDADAEGVYWCRPKHYHFVVPFIGARSVAVYATL